MPIETAMAARPSARRGCGIFEAGSTTRSAIAHSFVRVFPECAAIWRPPWLKVSVSQAG